MQNCQHLWLLCNTCIIIIIIITRLMTYVKSFTKWRIVSKGCMCKWSLHQYFCQHWRCRQPIVTVDVVFFLLSFSTYSIFLPKLRSLLLSGNKCDQLETLKRNVLKVCIKISVCSRLLFFCNLTWCTKIQPFLVFRLDASGLADAQSERQSTGLMQRILNCD